MGEHVFDVVGVSGSGQVMARVVDWWRYAMNRG